MQHLDPRDARVPTTPSSSTGQGLSTAAALRAALARLSSAPDARESAISLLLLARTVIGGPGSEGSGAVVELSSHEGGLLVTIEDGRGLWGAGLLALSMPTAERLLSEMPELAPGVERIEVEGGFVLRLSRSERPSSRAPWPTPTELPSLELLAQAGLVTAPSTER